MYKQIFQKKCINKYSNIYFFFQTAMQVYLPGKESKEIGPHITTKDELDALYKNIQTSVSEKEDINENNE